MIRLFNRIGFIIIALLVIFSCEPPENDEVEVECDPLFDPNCGSAEYNPETTIIVPSSPVNTSSISISWEGGIAFSQFSYRLLPLSYGDNPINLYIDWSDWSPDTAVTLEQLDEGDYNFYVKSRFGDTEEANPDSVNFTIDAITGPALRIYPLRQEVTPNSSFDVDIYLEEIESVENIIFLKIYIDFNPEFLTYAGFEKNAGEYDLSLFPSPTNETSQIIIEGGLLDSNISGTGPIGKLTFVTNPQAETAQINISESTFYMLGSSNDTLTFSSTVGGLIQVGQ